jgi:uncharacterized protein (DUF2235 family)
MKIEAGAAENIPRNLVVLSDGTGNGAGAFWKTNVWRLYQALDVAECPKRVAGKDVPRQIAWYDDGVGTSSFRPLALLGGAVGWGLKRNVLDLYTFLCRNYRPHDRIYGFGFSRGAFTARIVVDMVASEGLLTGLTEEELNRATRDAYREYRKCFNQTGKLVDVMRWMRDRSIQLWRWTRGQRTYAGIKAAHHTPVDKIAFVGVWDTVGAYGLPLQELTRGIDYWVWPLSMPNYALSEKVERACHALALDDERDTFHPLIWDEIDDPNPDRIQQVWFAGMHADVGGGYPDDALAHVPLRWMMEQARRAGLRFKRSAWAEVDGLIDGFGPLHDSRRGVAAYYRYQPRRISARIEPPDPITRIMQPPDKRAARLRQPVKVHESVFRRIAAGSDRYAPIVLPERFVVVRSDGTPVQGLFTAAGDAVRIASQERVWDGVWQRRVSYFATVGLSLALVALPFIQLWRPPGACEHPFCFVAPAIGASAAFVPGFLDWWVEAFARVPFTFLMLVAAIVASMLWGAGLQRRIQNQMRAIWDSALSTSPPAVQVRQSWLQRRRSSDGYQRLFHVLKWQVVPHSFGLIILLALVSIAVLVPLRANLTLAEMSGRICEIFDGQTAGEDPANAFVPTDPCWSTGTDVHEGEVYRITLNTDVDGRNSWKDDTIEVTPNGFTNGYRLPWYIEYLAWPLRRSLADGWFQTMAKVIPDDHKSSGRLHPLTFRQRNGAGTAYEAEFKAPGSGRLQLFVNDAVLSWWGGLDGTYYANNKGVAAVTIEPVERASIGGSRGS